MTTLPKVSERLGKGSVARRVVRCELGATLHADEAGLGMGRLEPGRAGPRRRRRCASRGGVERALRTRADRARCLFGRDPADHEQHRRLGAAFHWRRSRRCARRREALAVDAAADDGEIVEAAAANSRAAACVGTNVRPLRLWKRRSRPSTGPAKNPTRKSGCTGGIGRNRTWWRCRARGRGERRPRHRPRRRRC